ncbi:hypothetical protein [Micromonospora sp. WMMD998]|uniref:hypothetical protein n=1 Tax=Micromonospora sp. WMMD998 TaxID=3016092 RepID=UPI002499B4DD|nr:hypothetical protein [Micromonospora sp. WMMD998]WFE41957.1 hypothetical protein O7619_27315 [Micromonospora sp. WMMD998]
MQRRIPLMRFRFAEADHERYGDGWWTFDEAALTRLRARELMALDEELREHLGVNVITALDSYLKGGTVGALAVMWMARRFAGVDESLADFDPLPMLAEVKLLKATDDNPPASTSSPSPVSEEA